MRLGLVEYTGSRLGSFEIKRGDYERRLWTAAKTQSEDVAQKRRWLPEGEARSYDVLSDFVVVRWGQERVKKAVSPPSPVAAPLSALLLARQAEEETRVEMQMSEQEQPEYVMSATGVVHIRTCGYASKKPVGEFWLMEDASADTRFKKWHRCVRKD